MLHRLANVCSVGSVIFESKRKAAEASLDQEQPVIFYDLPCCYSSDLISTKPDFRMSKAALVQCTQVLVPSFNSLSNKASSGRMSSQQSNTSTVVQTIQPFPKLQFSGQVGVQIQTVPKFGSLFSETAYCVVLYIIVCFDLGSVSFWCQVHRGTATFSDALQSPLLRALALKPMCSPGSGKAPNLTAAVMCRHWNAQSFLSLLLPHLPYPCLFSLLPSS